MKIWTRFSHRYLGAGAAGSAERRVELMVLALAVVLLVQWLLGGIGVAMLAEPEAIGPELGGADDQVVGLERVSSAQREEISARPLFWVSRRPEPAARGRGTAGADTGGGRLNDVTLLGVFGSGGTAGVIALVGERKVRILLGEQLNGWELEAVHPDRVEFARSGRRETLSLTPGIYKGARANPVSREPRGTDVRRRPGAETGPAQVNDNEKKGESPAPQLGWGG